MNNLFFENRIIFQNPLEKPPAKIEGIKIETAKVEAGELDKKDNEMIAKNDIEAREKGKRFINEALRRSENIKPAVS